MDLYIFGAGASAAEGAPVTRDLFARAFGYLSPAFDDRVAQVWRFLEAVFEVPVDGPDAFAALPPVDEVISLVDWSLHADQGLGEKSQRGDSRRERGEGVIPKKHGEGG